MLPFLKSKQEGAMSGPVDILERVPDDGSEELSMLDAVADDMIDAIHKKDKSLLKSALEALCEYIKEEDEEQDESLTNKDHES